MTRQGQRTTLASDPRAAPRPPAASPNSDGDRAFVSLRRRASSRNAGPTPRPGSDRRQQMPEIDSERRRKLDWLAALTAAVAAGAPLSAAANPPNCQPWNSTIAYTAGAVVI